MRLTEKDMLCCPVPLFHCFGLVLASLAAMTHGAGIIYPSQSFEPEATLRAVSEEGATALHGVPTMFLEEMNHPNFAKYNLSTLRTGIAAGSPVPIEVMKNVQAKMHLRELTICYGMTETSPVSFMTLTDDTLKDRCETVGRIMPHMEAKGTASERERERGLRERKPSIAMFFNLCTFARNNGLTPIPHCLCPSCLP